MLRKAAVTLSLCVLLAAQFGLVVGPLQGRLPVPEPLRWTGADRPRAERTVFLGGRLSEEQTVAFTAAVQASGYPGVVLFDTPTSRNWTRAFLKAFQPTQVVAVGSFPEGIADLDLRLGIKTARTFRWEDGQPPDLQRALFPQAPRVVVTPAEPRRLLLQAACLAGVLEAPLLVRQGRPGDATELKGCLEGWGTRELHAVGDTAKLCRNLPGVRVVSLADEAAVFEAYVRYQHKKGSLKTLILANPADTGPGRGGMSALAPWVALQKHAALLLTNEDGSNPETVVRAALRRPELQNADTLILLANLRAIPMKRCPNPVEGDRDEFIEMEPMTPQSDEPVSFATGRLFHDDPNVVALMLARSRLLRPEAGFKHKALIVSNPGGGLPLLEALSRNTATEFRNAGYDVTPFFGRQAKKDTVRRLLPEQTVFLWEGHHSTLVRDYGIHEWSEPLRPSLVFLQSCLALAEPKAQPFLERGSVGVIGTSSRTYSGSGGAFALAFFDAFLYEDQTLGGSLRHAKNFMLAFAKLKDKRLGGQSKLRGANLRAAWAFSLWGDPTLKMPRPTPPAGALPSVRHEVRGNAIVVSLPEDAHEKLQTASYQADVRPNARLAGLRLKQDEDNAHRLVPLVFVEVSLPGSGKTPVLRSKLPESRWVFCWDSRTRRGYLLLTPRASDRGELRFQIVWN
ncbi:MAG TPA: C25 family cysteine peptidase [Gemmataceae bacterium]|nr:C25 family cysteine peptidase [Gemmataceae bacterium]